jgi:hypothetical protein
MRASRELLSGSLLVMPTGRASPQKVAAESIGPNQVWQLDFTEFVLS